MIDQNPNQPKDPNLRRPPSAGVPSRAPAPQPTGMQMPGKKKGNNIKALLIGMGITGGSAGIGLWIF